MRHDRVVIGIDPLQKIERAIASIFEAQGDEGRARMLGFFNLLERPESVEVRFHIRRSGRIVLTVLAPPEKS